ncbi:glycosyltransferase family protein [Arenibacterium halophilum]|uniref:Glycosyltransferase n=1 Tax=Arenibacterium halophilum TaxID=2583821 RepID=A0ABY2X7K7_9RHOB|nr:glycosyltransferase [Arenibacterium halophilum]TMV11402.1 glycosyltransferase [Arenibacterium halophilum]
MKVLIVTTHLLGTGHLARAATLTRAFQSEGHAVRLVSGGFPAPQLDLSGLDVVQLPPLRSDGTDFARLLTVGDQPADATCHDARRSRLVATLLGFSPDVLITELFPFGRRMLRQEFLALLSAAARMARRPVVLASVRDILAPPSSPAKADQTQAWLDEHYDGVLVHSDPALVRLDASWPMNDHLRPMLHYTGFVAPPPPAPHPAGAGHGEILVSAGGGRVGQPLFRAALDAAQLTPDLRWRLLVGGGAADALRTSHPDSPAIIEPARPDFRQMLPLAAASVSMCGYNTALDLLQTGCPAVVVPFDDGAEVEQTLRARALARAGAVSVLTSADLSGKALAEAVTRAIATPRRSGEGPRCDGGASSVAIAERLAEARAL